MSADGSGQKQLTTALKVNYRDRPVWSPDSQKIAFVVNGEFIGQDQTSEIYVVNADGTNLRQLTQTGGANLNPQWSPDGKQLVFYGYAVSAFDDIGSTTSLRTEVFRMNADGSDLINLTNNGGLDYQPEWSPDGNWIAFASTRKSPGIYIMRPDGLDIQMVTHEPPFSEGGRTTPSPTSPRAGVSRIPVGSPCSTARRMVRARTRRCAADRLPPLRSTDGRIVVGTHTSCRNGDEAFLGGPKQSAGGPAHFAQSPR